MSDPKSAEFQAVAEKFRSPFSVFRMLSGGFRSRVSESLGAAAVLHDERRVIEADRDTIQQELRDYRAALQKAADDLERLGGHLTKTMQSAQSTEAEVLDVQKRALSQEKKERDLAEEDRRLLALSEGLGRRHHELTQLAERLSHAESTNSHLLAQTREIEEAVRSQLANLDQRGARLSSDEEAFAERRRTLSAGEGTLEAGRTTLAAAERAAAQRKSELDTKDTRLTDLQDRLERDQAAVNDMHSKLVTLVETNQQHERVMDAHQKEWSKRLAEQDARAAALDTRSAELDSRKLAYDRERVVLDAKIAQLSDLEERNEKLLRFKAYLDDDQKRLNSESAGVRENQKRTVDTWEELKTTLARLEELDRRVQETNDRIEHLREETERRDREATEAARHRSLQLDAREREILNWRMQSELRERKVQERYNELDTVEARKAAVRSEIEQLERDHAGRMTDWEREQQRARQLWSERRAEAEKARELYERNTGLVEKRLAEVAQREKEHQQRAESLEERTAQLAERERRLRVVEDRVRLLEEQRDSLNAVIASLTTQVGREWAAPESRLGGPMTPSPLTPGAVGAGVFATPAGAGLDQPQMTPPPRRPAESSPSSPKRNGGGSGS